MTREEAIRLISWMKCTTNREDDLEAIDMAIEALSADALQEVVPTVVRVTMSDGSQYYLEHERDAIQADAVSREEYEEVKAYMDTLVDAFIEDGEELAESVKVVRCKDCRHRDLFSCPLANNDFQKDEDFCSWGERKEESEDEE